MQHPFQDKSQKKSLQKSPQISQSKLQKINFKIDRDFNE